MHFAENPKRSIYLMGDFGDAGGSKQTSPNSAHHWACAHSSEHAHNCERGPVCSLPPASQSLPLLKKLILTFATCICSRNIWDVEDKDPEKFSSSWIYIGLVSANANTEVLKRLVHEGCAKHDFTFCVLLAWRFSSYQGVPSVLTLAFQLASYHWSSVDQTGKT